MSRINLHAAPFPRGTVCAAVSLPDRNAGHPVHASSREYFCSCSFATRMNSCVARDM